MFFDVITVNIRCCVLVSLSFSSLSQYRREAKVYLEVRGQRREGGFNVRVNIGSIIGSMLKCAVGVICARRWTFPGDASFLIDGAHHYRWMLVCFLLPQGSAYSLYIS